MTRKIEGIPQRKLGKMTAKCNLRFWIGSWNIRRALSGTAGKIQIRFVDQLIVLYKSQLFVLENYALWLYKLLILEGTENSCVLFLQIYYKSKIISK